jgi:multicomponent Na+:H+ antiporter subunit E
MSVYRKDLHPLLRIPFRIWAFIRFLLFFSRELVLSNIQVARAVLFGRRDAIETGLARYPIGHLRPAELLILSHCITLTPGTTTLEISEDRQSMMLHMFDGRDPQAAMDGIKASLEAPIVAFMR